MNTDAADVAFRAVSDVEPAGDEPRAEGTEILPDPRELTTRDTTMVADPDDDSITPHGRSDVAHGRVDPFPGPEP